jgi:hypothetical protein
MRQDIAVCNPDRASPTLDAAAVGNGGGVQAATVGNGGGVQAATVLQDPSGPYVPSTILGWRACSQLLEQSNLLAPGGRGATAL